MSIDLIPIEVGRLIASFIVYGHPAPQGSKKAIPIYRGSVAKGNRQFTGHSAVVEQMDDEIKSWRERVHNAAREVVSCGCGEPGCVAMRPPFPVDEAVIGRAVFSYERPRSHYRTGRNAHLLREGAPLRPIAKKNDCSKLLRSTEDALKIAGLYRDDGLIVDYTRVGKVFCGEDPEALPIPGARLSFWLMPDGIEREVSTREPGQESLESLFL